MTISRDEALDRLALASQFGHLGLFIGSGFSISLTNRTAPNFEQLIRQVAQKLSLSLNLDDASQIRGYSYPQIASALVSELHEKLRAADPTSTIDRAIKDFKAEVSRQCDLRPDPALRTQYTSVLCKLPLSWIITTNYDFILES